MLVFRKLLIHLSLECNNYRKFTKCKHLCEIETFCENACAHMNYGPGWVRIVKQTEGPKSCDTVPLSILVKAMYFGWLQCRDPKFLKPKYSRPHSDVKASVSVVSNKSFMTDCKKFEWERQKCENTIFKKYFRDNCFQLKKSHAVVGAEAETTSKVWLRLLPKSLAAALPLFLLVYEY